MNIIKRVYSFSINQNFINNGQMKSWQTCNVMWRHVTSCNGYVIWLDMTVLGSYVGIWVQFLKALMVYLLCFFFWQHFYSSFDAPIRFSYKSAWLPMCVKNTIVRFRVFSSQMFLPWRKPVLSSYFDIWIRFLKALMAYLLCFSRFLWRTASLGWTRRGKLRRNLPTYVSKFTVLRAANM